MGGATFDQGLKGKGKAVFSGEELISKMCLHLGTGFEDQTKGGGGVDSRENTRVYRQAKGKGRQCQRGASPCGGKLGYPKKGGGCENENNGDSPQPSSERGNKRQHKKKAG